MDGENPAPQTSGGNGHEFSALLRPRSIAIVGASADPTKLNHRMLRYLIDNGFTGKIYPVNPKYTEIAGLRSYPDLAAIPGPVDLAAVMVPAAQVARAIRDAGRKRVPCAMVHASGFAELGEEGTRLQEEMLREARAGGVRICGSNMVGLVNMFDRIVATFSQVGSSGILAGPRRANRRQSVHRGTFRHRIQGMFEQDVNHLLFVEHLLKDLKRNFGLSQRTAKAVLHLLGVLPVPVGVKALDAPHVVFEESADRLKCYEVGVTQTTRDYAANPRGRFHQDNRAPLLSRSDRGSDSGDSSAVDQDVVRLTERRETYQQ